MERELDLSPVGTPAVQYARLQPHNAVFGILARGEGWHNNHHAFSTSARHGLEWWQIDTSYLVIRALALLGLASDIRVPSAERIAAKRVKRV